MFIATYYLFIVLYSLVFLHIFPTKLFEFTNGWWYFYLALSLLFATILSFLTQLLILRIMSLLRSKKDITNRFNHLYASHLLSFGNHLMRVKVIVTGKEHIPDHPFILIGNHQENYDILIIKPIFGSRPLSFIAKEALRKMPIFGRWMVILGNVFISRDADRSAAESIIKGIRNYKHGLSMGIFPEGKRSFGNEMIEFKPGAFKLAMKSKADILIVTQYNTCKIFKSFPWRRYRVYVHIHEILRYEEYCEMNSHELSDFIKSTIQEQLDHFNEKL